MTTTYDSAIYQNLTNDTFNDTTPCFENDDDQVHAWFSIKIILGLLYCTVFSLAVGGNSLVIYVVVTNRSMQSVTNLFITSLAVSDLAVNVTSLWLTPVYSYLKRWVWGQALCYAMPLFQGTTIFISSFTLTAIAVDRYVVIVYPFKPRMSRKVCLLVICCIWLVSLSFLTPYAFHMKMTYIHKCDIYICHEHWPKQEIKVVFGIVVMTLQFGVPFLLIAFCYTLIWFHLKFRSKALGPRSDADLLRKRRMLKMLISMVVIYALCWIPPNVMNMIHDAFGAEITQNLTYFVFIYIFSHLISMTATMWNPFLYAFMNDSFKREFRIVLGRCCMTDEKKKKLLQHRRSTTTTLNLSRTETGKFLSKTVNDDSRLKVKFSLIPPMPSKNDEKNGSTNMVFKETELSAGSHNNSTVTTSLKISRNNSFDEQEFLL